MVMKEFDVRTVLLGRDINSYAVRTATSTLDWRHQAIGGNIDVSMITTPADVKRGILDFAAKTGVCFGSMDFAVDAAGQWWFLEINEQGQFLWLDEFVPEGRLQQKFCAFITAPMESTGWAETREDLFPSFREYRAAHQGEKAPDLAENTAQSLWRSVEP
jgi:hypothetical protein